MSFMSCFAVLLLGLCTHVAASSFHEGKYDLTIRVQQCRGGCLGKYATKESLCVLHAECSACWDECAKVPKINKSIRETWALRTTLMLQQDSLVLADVAWDPLSTGNQCLVTWEVSGGGLMGNLLTESFNVQLSLWPDTKYRVQVTCKNKITGAMSRSLPLTIDTSEATTASPERIPQPVQKPTLTPKMSTPVSPPNVVQEIVPASNHISGGVPFDDQSSESINQHTNFIFNWHQKNSDISKIEPLSKPDINVLRITSLSEIQNPLLFDMILGCIILIIILCLYMLLLRNQQKPADKTALIEGDSNSYPSVSTPVAIAIQRNATLPSSSSISTPPQFCKNAATCSRNALKV